MHIFEDKHWSETGQYSHRGQFMCISHGTVNPVTKLEESQKHFEPCPKIMRHVPKEIHLWW